MEIQAIANVGVCTEFMSSKDADKTELSVVIAPIKVVAGSEEGRIQIISGCNFWRSCHNTDCYYSLAAREKQKV